MVGAGTMGAGIAALAEGSVLYDPNVEAHSDPAGLAECDLIIEAVPEDLELKRKVLAELPEDAVLATNTSSLSVTEIAAGVVNPERVVGLHFFNPPGKMKLVEVVAGAQSSPAAIACARAAAGAMGKHVVDAPDIPGFLVNRVNRPYSLESLKLLEEGVGDHETIDRILRLGAGFRMGPFALMDLVGIDVNHAVAESMFRRSFGEPRYRPSPLAAAKVAAGTLGRKTGQGWYAHPRGRDSGDSPLSRTPANQGTVPSVAVLGDEPLARQLRKALGAVGIAEGDWLTVTFGPPAEGHVLRIVRDDFLHDTQPEATGFHAVAPFDAVKLVELTRTPGTDPETFARAETMFAALGRDTQAVEDVPGLVTGRVVCQLINEAHFLTSATREDVDAGMELGVAHPRGPYAWADAIGLPQVVATLDGLHRALGDPRYRVAPALRKAAALA